VARLTNAVQFRCEINLADDEALLVQQDPVLGSKLDPPLTGALIVNGLATVRAVAGGGVAANRKFHRLAQAVVAIPPMLDRCSRRRLDPRVKNELTLTDWRGWRNAAPVAGRATG